MLRVLGVNHSRRAQTVVGWKELPSPGAGAANPEGAKRLEFPKKVERGTTVVPGWNPGFSFHPWDFESNRELVPSALCIVDAMSRLASQRTR
jgi:hypothetical protein